MLTSMNVTAFVVLLLCLVAGSASAAISTNAPVPGQPPLHIVTLRKGTDLEGLLREHGVAPKFRWRKLGGFAAPLSEAQIQRLKADPRVLFVEKDGPVKPCALLPTQVGLLRIKGDRFPPARINGIHQPLDVDVAVFDSGIDPHEALPPSYHWFSPFSEYPSDETGHGTVVTGIIAGLDNGNGFVGVAPGVRIWNYKC
jgi:subtilisin family serine protease